MTINNKGTLLASVAVLSNLCNNSKDVYDVIAAFVKQLFVERIGASFSLGEIKDEICNRYGFDLPEGVFKSSIRSRLKGNISKNKFGKYELTTPFVNVSPIEKDELRVVDSLIDDLIEYLNSTIKCVITRDELLDQLKKCLFDENCDENLKKALNYYIIERKGSSHEKTLNLIKQGFILYYGIKSSPKNEMNAVWPSNLTIFLDTEILFDLAGYNGSSYQAVADELICLIKELNSRERNGREKIKLRYLEQSQNVVDNFFHAAQKRKGSTSNTFVKPSAAMDYILKNAEDASDVLKMKTKLKSMLKSRGIIQCEGIVSADFDIAYDEKILSAKQEYSTLEVNVLDDSFIEIKADKSIEILSVINTLRNGISNKGFEHTENILLTRKSLTKYLAAIWKGDSKDVPLATSIDFLTNRFWFKLNKGFGQSAKLPLTANVLVCARQIISSQVDEKISSDFLKIKSKHEKGEISDRDLVAYYEELRSQNVGPDDINENSIKNIRTYISEDMIEQYHREKQSKQRQIELGQTAQKSVSIAQRKFLDRERKKTRVLIKLIFVLLKGLTSSVTIGLFFVIEAALVWISMITKDEISFLNEAAAVVVPLAVAFVFCLFLTMNKALDSKQRNYVLKFYKKKMNLNVSKVKSYFQE